MKTYIPVVVDLVVFMSLWMLAYWILNRYFKDINVSILMAAGYFVGITCLNVGKTAASITEKLLQ